MRSLRQACPGVQNVGSHRAAVFLLAATLPMFVLAGSASLFPALAGFEFEKGSLSGDLNGSVQLSGPIRFVQDTPGEAPSVFLLLKSNLHAGEHLAFYGEIRSGYDGSARSPENEGLFIRWDEVYPSKDRTLEVAEAYLNLFLGDLDLRLGVQKFAWGTLDQINPTDNLSPLDLRNILSANPLERKIGVPALRALYGSVASFVQIEAVWIPFLVPFRFPDPGDRWYPPLFQSPESLEVSVPGLPFTVPLRIEQINDEPDLPARNFRHSELGIRLARTLGNVDLGVSYFNGYDRRPVIRADGTVVADFELLPPQADFSYLLHVRPEFHRMQVYGMDLAAGWGSMTLRAEAAYIKNRFINVGLQALDELVDQFELPPLSDLTFISQPNGIQIQFPYSPKIAYPKNVLSSGGGVDYQWGNHLLTLQVIGETILNPHGETLIYEDVEIFIVFGTHSRFKEDTLQVEAGLLCNPMEELWIGSMDTTYAVTDAITVGFNLLVMDGKSMSPFGQFSRNDQIEFFARYSF